MTKEDTGIMSGNVDGLAVFSDVFCDKLRGSPRRARPDGDGEDRVGELFLSMVSCSVRHVPPPAVG